MRRILRIWPLYIFIITLAFIVLPNIELFTLPGYGKDIIYSNLGWKLNLVCYFLPEPSPFIVWFCPLRFSYMVNWNRRTILFGLASYSSIHKESSNFINGLHYHFLLGHKILFNNIIWALYSL